jgi:hypothetical protein
MKAHGYNLDVVIDNLGLQYYYPILERQTF